MANVHGAFAASERSTAIVEEARRAVADLVNGTAEAVVFGPNMTTLTIHIADALSREWSQGDEIVVTSLDQNAKARPWGMAAERTSMRAPPTSCSGRTQARPSPARSSWSR